MRQQNSDLKTAADQESAAGVTGPATWTHRVTSVCQHVEMYEAVTQ